MTHSGVRGEGVRPDAVRSAGDGAAERDGPGTNGAGGGRRGHGGRPGRRHRVLRWSAMTLSVLILGTAGAGYLYYRHLNGNIEKGERSSVTPSISTFSQP